MDIDRLHYFVTIIDTGSLVRASELLNISQPALSKSMKVLEDELGVKLFVQSGRGIVPTDKGKSIAVKARSIIEDVNNLTVTETKASDVIRLGTFEVFSTYFMGAMISQYFPDSSIELYELTPGKMEEALVLGEIDYAITYIPVPHPLLDFHEIAHTNMCVVAREDKFSDIPFKDVPFVIPITPVTGSPNKVKGLDGWPDDRLPRNIKYRVTLMESGLDLCRQGLAAAYLPRFIVDLHNNSVKASLKLQELSMPGMKAASRKQPVYLIKRKSDAESATHKKLAKALRQLVK